MTFKKVAQGTALAMVLSVVGNVVLLFLGRALGLSLIVPHGPEHIPTVLGVSDVVIASVLPLAIAGLLFLVLVKYTKKPVTIFRTVAVLIFVVSFGPLAQEIDNPTRILLALMHVVSAVAVVWALTAPGRLPARVEARA